MFSVGGRFNVRCDTIVFYLQKSGRVKSAGIRTSNRRAVVSLTRPKSSPHERHKSAEPVQEYEQTVVSTILVEDL